MNKTFWSYLLIIGLQIFLSLSCDAKTDSKKIKYEFSDDWFSQHIDAWNSLNQREKFSQRPDFQYLEIGVFEGRSLIWVLENFLTGPRSKATAIDVFYDPTYENRLKKNLERGGFEKRTTILKGKSKEILRKLDKSTFDLIYIDASHKLKDVLYDMMLSWDLLKVGGVLIFDDYRLPGPADGTPKLAIDVFLTAFGGELTLLKKGDQVVVKKEFDSCSEDTCIEIGPYKMWLWVWELVDKKTGKKIPTTEDERKILSKWYYEQSVSYKNKAVTTNPELQALFKKLSLKE